MTVEYLDLSSIREGLWVVLDALVGLWRRKGYRASQAGILSGMGFDQLDPYLIVYGYISRGLLAKRSSAFQLTREGLEALTIVSDVAETIREDAEFPEFDGGKLLGAVVYALYDWQNSYPGAEEYLKYLGEVRERVARLKSENPKAFKLVAMTLPRLKFDEGYTVERLLDAAEKVALSHAHPS
ncbi:hypothetical protein [Thermofilum pendens]|nr:hypothetical protein [Thermofilum pendens]